VPIFWLPLAGTEVAPRRGVRPVLIIAVIACSSGCGSKSGLDLGSGVAAAGAGGTETAGGAAGGAAPGSGGTGGTGGAPAPCVNWSVATPVPVAFTDPIGDSALTGLARDDDRIFVASTNDNDPSPDPTFRVRSASLDLSTLGASEVALTRPQSVSYSGLGIASGFGRHGGVSWDEANGCRFVSFDVNAVPSTPTKIEDVWCYWAFATESGFIAFASPTFQLSPLELLTLDGAGALISKKSDLTPPESGSSYPLARARFDDGTILLGWSSDFSSTTLQRFSESGDALGAPVHGFPYGPEASLALASLGASGLVAWTPGSANPGQVSVQSIDEDGAPNGLVSTLAPASGILAGRVDVARAGGGALVVWTQGNLGAYHAMVAQPVSAEGIANAPPLTIPAPGYVGTLRVIGLDDGAIVVFEAENAAPTQVFATRLSCAS
jgi:hypothetical protein